MATTHGSTNGAGTAPRIGMPVPPLYQRKDAPALQASPPSFQWPLGRSASDAQKQRFASTLFALMQARGMTHIDLATAVFGGVQSVRGVRPKGIGEVRAWLRGTRIPTTEEGVRRLAIALNVPAAALLPESAAPINRKAVERLFRPRGEFKGEKLGATKKAAPRVSVPAAAPASIAPPPTTTLELTPAPAPTPQLPKGAKPALMDLKTNRADQRWVDVRLEGTMPSELAQTIFALLNPPRAL